MGAPVARLALPDARMLLTSFSVIGAPSMPTSPMMPDRDASVSDADGDVPDYLVGQVLNRPVVHICRMVELLVPARAHYDVESSSVGHTSHRLRVPPDTDAGDLDDGATPMISELQSLVYRRLLVHKHIVVADSLAVAGQFELVHGQFLFPQTPFRSRRVEVRLEGPVESDEQVLVHQCGPKLVRGYGALNGHHLASHVRYVRSHGLLLSAVPTSR